MKAYMEKNTLHSNHNFIQESSKQSHMLHRYIYCSTIDEKTLKKLLRQIMIQSFINHSRLVHLYNFFVDEEVAYLVLEPCLGKNLYQNLQEVSKFHEFFLKEYIKQVCQGIDYMHENDILHRYLKPLSIFLHENMIKICYFGWAVHSPLLRGTACGRPLYKSPQIVSKVPQDKKIDIWSIGILTYQLMYGNIPFQIRNPRAMTKIIQQVVYFSRDNLISQTAKYFIRPCLEKNPNDGPTARKILEHYFLKNRQNMYRMTIV